MNWIVIIGIYAATIGFALTPATTRAVTTRDVIGNGGWKSDGKPQRSTQRWGLELKRCDDNSLRGRVSLGDSPLGSVGTVEGRINGSRVSGTISDDEGNLIANFDGTITKNGFSGKYVDRTGETGEWSWDGAPPQ